MDRIDISIDENVSVALARIAALGADLTPQMAQIAQLLGTETRLNFVKQSAPDGTPWAITERKRLDPSASILRLKGDLSGSIREEWGKDFAAAGPEKSGGAAVYAALHQFGANIVAKVGKALKTPFGLKRSVRIQARPYLGFTTPIIDRALQILAQPFLAVGSQEARS